MSESERIKAMFETLYGHEGMVATVAEMRGGINALKWMVGVVLIVVSLIFGYLTYVTQSHPGRTALMSSDPTMTASSLGDQ